MDGDIIKKVWHVSDEDGGYDKLIVCSVFRLIAVCTSELFLYHVFFCQ